MQRVMATLNAEQQLSQGEHNSRIDFWLSTSESSSWRPTALQHSELFARTAFQRGGGGLQWSFSEFKTGVWSLRCWLSRSLTDKDNVCLHATA